MCCVVLQCVAVCCSVLQCAEVCCSEFGLSTFDVPRGAASEGVGGSQGKMIVCCSVRQYVVQLCAAVCCSVLQCAAVCCSVLQCAAVCCSDRESCAAEREREREIRLM